MANIACHDRPLSCEGLTGNQRVEVAYRAPATSKQAADPPCDLGIVSSQFDDVDPEQGFFDASPFDHGVGVHP